MIADRRLPLGAGAFEVSDRGFKADAAGRKLDRHAFNQGANRGAVEPENEIAFPVAWHGAVVCLEWYRQKEGQNAKEAAQTRGKLGNEAFVSKAPAKPMNMAANVKAPSLYQ